MPLTFPSAIPASPSARQAQLEAVFAHIDYGVLTYTPEGRLQDCNPAALRLHGLDSPHEDAAILQRFAECFELATPDGEALPAGQWPLARVLAGETLRESEIRVRRRDGNWERHFIYGGSLIRDAAGAPLLALLTLRASPATQRREETLGAGETERWRQEAGFRATFEQAAVGVAHVASDGSWLRVNQKLCDILGYSREELLQRTFQAITHPADLDADLVLLEQVLCGELDTYAMEKRYLHRKGHPVWVNLTVSLVRTAHGQPDYFISVVEDIQARKAAEQALEEEREMFHDLAEIASDYFWSLDTEFRFTSISPAIGKRSGLDYLSYLGKTRWELPTIGVSAADWKRHQAILAAHHAFRNFEFGLQNQKGEVRWFNISGGPLFAKSGEFRGYRGVTQDITERRRIEECLRQQAMVFNCTQEGVVITDRAGHILDANPAFQWISEYSLDEVRGHNLRFLKSGRQEPGFYRQMWQTLLETGSWQGEIWNRRKQGEIYLEWLSISAVRDAEGRVANYVGISIDLSRMNHAQSELERLAHHDGLTNLPNRTALLSRLEHAIEMARRHARKGAVLFMDLDRFKPVNDTLGHQAGDELLQAVAGRLAGRLREIDTVARLGGDEFVILLEEISGPEAAATVARDVIRHLEKPFPLSCGIDARIGASVGIAIFPGDGDSSARVLERADQALYVAKGAGRGTHRFYGQAG